MTSKAVTTQPKAHTAQLRYKKAATKQLRNSDLQRNREQLLIFVGDFRWQNIFVLINPIIYKASVNNANQTSKLSTVKKLLVTAHSTKYTRDLTINSEKCEDAQRLQHHLHHTVFVYYCLLCLRTAQRHEKTVQYLHNTLQQEQM